MIQNKILVASISATIFMVGGSLLLYTVSNATWQSAESDVLELIPKEWHLTHDEKKPPALVSVSDLDTADTSFRYNNREDVVITSAVITNPMDKHAVACVRGRLIDINSESHYSTAYCFQDIGPYDTVRQELSIALYQARMVDMCYDRSLYGTQYSEYLKELGEWSVRVETYKTKQLQDPTYTRALGVLQHQKPQPPEKVLSWKLCSFQLVDAFPNKK